MLLNKISLKKWNQEFWGFSLLLQIPEKRLLLFCCKVTDQAITHVINFPQKWSKSMFIVIVVQNLKQKEQQSTIFVKVAMVTTFTWKSEVSQCKSVEFMLSTLLL